MPCKLSADLSLLSHLSPAPFQWDIHIVGQVKDFTAVLENKEANDHTVLFYNTMHFLDRTVLNARLHAAVRNSDGEEPSTTFKIHVLDNDTMAEVCSIFFCHVLDCSRE